MSDMAGNAARVAVERCGEAAEIQLIVRASQLQITWVSANLPA